MSLSSTFVYPCTNLYSYQTIIFAGALCVTMETQKRRNVQSQQNRGVSGNRIGNGGSGLCHFPEKDLVEVWCIRLEGRVGMGRDAVNQQSDKVLSLPRAQVFRALEAELLLPGARINNGPYCAQMEVVIDDTGRLFLAQAVGCGSCRFSELEELDAINMFKLQRSCKCHNVPEAMGHLIDDGGQVKVAYEFPYENMFSQLFKRDGPFELTERELTTLIKHIVRLLEKANQRGVVHGDVDLNTIMACVPRDRAR